MKYVRLKAIGTSKFASIIKILDTVKEEGLIEDYAICGGYALAIRAEAISTFDVDVMCKFKHSFLIDFSDLYTRLKELGCTPKDEYVLVHNVPVQFLTVAPNSVEEEALENAQVESAFGAKFRVLSLEYLLAIMCKVGRKKDKLKFEMIRENLEVDTIVLKKVLKEFKLLEKWAKFVE